MSDLRQALEKWAYGEEKIESHSGHWYLQRTPEMMLELLWPVIAAAELYTSDQVDAETLENALAALREKVGK